MLDILQNFLHLVESSIAVITFCGGVVVWIFTQGKKLHEKINNIYEELTPNHGTSLRDAIGRIEAFQRGTLKMLNKAWWISDAEGRCTDASHLLCEITGVSSDQIVGLGWISSVSSSYREECRKEWDSAIKDQREFHCKYSFTTPEGEIVEVIGHAFPIFTKDKKQNKYVACYIGHVDVLGGGNGKD